jgi:transcriptional regulator with XRE-family HTH domain
MNVKEILKSNGITQEEFANYIGIDRVSLNKNLNNSTQKKGMINNLKMIVAEKRGIKIEIAL